MLKSEAVGNRIRKVELPATATLNDRFKLKVHEHFKKFKITSFRMFKVSIENNKTFVYYVVKY